MATFPLHLISPEALVYSGEVDQVDLPGAAGDLGILAGHAPTVAMLRPGIVTILAGGKKAARFVVLGGLAEMSSTLLTVLADTAKPVDEFDISSFKAEIEALEESLPLRDPGEDFDRAIARLDHYRSIHHDLTSQLVAPF
jgi:F-type H+-transporting ATPase subunit epsilon